MDSSRSRLAREASALPCAVARNQLGLKPGIFESLVQRLKCTKAYCEPILEFNGDELQALTA